MNVTIDSISTHAVAPEKLMALVDGELSAAEVQAVSTHLTGCAECAALAEEFRNTSASLATWRVPPIPEKLEEMILDLVAQRASGRNTRTQRRGGWNWKPLTIGGAITIAMLLVLAVAPTFHKQRLALFFRPDEMKVTQPATASMPAPPPPPVPRPMNSNLSVGDFNDLPINGRNIAALAELAPGVAGGTGGGGSEVSAYKPSGPMIARTVSLTILVKDMGTARPVLDAALARHHGYPAQLTVNTPEGTARSVQASLRVPAGELQAALGELRQLGRVQTESQSGEEVTQQHADLVQRLKTARETEDQLRDILQHRAGKMEEVLQVEQELARVRGEIEGMEGEQQALEHRVAFSSIDLQLNEEYKAPLTPPNGASGSLGTQTHNAFVAGYRHAASAVTGVFLFLVEFLPAMMVWIVILGLPAWLIWRRYRKVRAGI